MTESDEERVEGPLRPRGRHAAPASPASPLLARIAALVGAALAFLTARFEAFRAGPVIPWMSRHRLVLLIGGATLASVLALGGAVALIQGASSIAVDETGQQGDGGTPPDAESSEAGPVTSGTTTPTRTPTPTSTPTPTPAPPPATDAPLDPADPTTTAPEPVATPAPTEEPRRDTAPGATNRPDKPKD